MVLVREVCGFDKKTDELVWSTPVDEAAVRILADCLDTEDDEDLVFEYELVGEALEAAARLAGFEIRPDLDYFLSTHAVN